MGATVSKDLDAILENWPYEPGKVSVRKTLSADGRVKLQMRIDLGVLQMETEGRPDGQRPYGCESMLDYYTRLLARHRRTTGQDEGFTLDEQACELLRAEALQYYYRYLCEFVLEEFENVQRDTARNLRAMDFMASYAQEESDQSSMESYRPYIVMMNTRARANMAMQEHRPKQARRIIREALHSLREHYEQMGQEDVYRASPEVGTLQALLKDVRREIPMTPLERLRRQLAKAVKEERYEEAAQIRDTIARAQQRSSTE